MNTIDFIKGLILCLMISTTVTAEITLFQEDLPTNLNFICKDSTSLIGTSANITCYNETQSKVVDAGIMTNVATGIFNYTVSSSWPKGKYYCYVECESAARPVQPSGSIWIIPRCATQPNITDLQTHGDSNWGASGGDNATVIADAIWDELLSEHTMAGSFGKTISDLFTYVTDLWDQLIGGW